MHRKTVSPIEFLLNSIAYAKPYARFYNKEVEIRLAYVCKYISEAHKFFGQMKGDQWKRKSNHGYVQSIRKQEKSLVELLKINKNQTVNLRT